MLGKNIVRSFLSLVILLTMGISTHAWAGYTYSITPLKDFALADGTQQDIVVVQILNGGAGVQGLDVTFVINGGASGINPVISTDVNGKATLSLSSTVAGPATVDAYVGGVKVESIVVHFVASAGPPDLAHSTFTIDLGTNTADGLSACKLHAHIVDANSNPVAGVTVVFVVSGGTAGGTAVIVGTGVTDASGVASLSVTDIVAGTVTLQAYLGGIQLDQDRTVTFVAGPPSTSNPATKLIDDLDFQVADGTSTDKVHAHIVDINGNPVSGATITFTVIGGTASGTAVLSTVTATTDANGDAPITITNTMVGTVILTASVGGVTISPAAGLTVTFTSGPPDPTNAATQLIVDIPNAAADGVATCQVHAHIVDAGGRPVTGAAVTFAVIGGSAGSTAVLSTVTGTTNASGDAVLTLTDLQVGDVILTASVGGVTISPTGGVTVTFGAGVPDPNRSHLIVDIPSATADGVSFCQIHANIVDAQGHAVPNATVTFTINGGTAAGTAVFPASAVTDASGNATINITDITAGTVNINAYVNGVIILGCPGIVTFTVGAPDPTNPASQLVIDIGNAPDDGVSTCKVHAHIVDKTGNPVPGASVTFSVSGGTAGSTAVISGSPGTTDANGDAFITITNLKAGTVTISATVGGVALTNTVTVTFDPGPPDPTQSIIVTDVDNSPIDGTTPDVVHAHIVDAGGSAVPNAVVTFSLASGTANFTGSVTVTTDANGNASISLTSTVAGTVAVAAQVGGVDLSNSPHDVHFLNMPDVTNPQTRIFTVIYEALADGTSTTSVQAHIVDASGTPLPAQSVVFSVDSGNATIVTAQPVITDANGDAIITLTSTKPGIAAVTAKVNGISIVNGSPARVKFAPINIYVPRVFTPNGDGTNDVLKPILVGISAFHYFSVYNRWGNLVFTTQDPNVGWDGRFKGVLQPVETYLWIAEGVDMQGKKIVQKGMVSLVR